MKFDRTSRLYAGNAEIAPRSTTDLVVARKMFGGRRAASAEAVNIFNSNYRYASHLAGYTSFASIKEASKGRVFKLSLIWRFGQDKEAKAGVVEIARARNSSAWTRKNETLTCKAGTLGCVGRFLRSIDL